MMTFQVLNEKKSPWCSFEELLIKNGASQESYFIRKKRSGLKTVISIIPKGDGSGEIKLEYNPILRALYLGNIKIFVNGKLEGVLRRKYSMYSGLTLEGSETPYQIIGSIDSHTEIQVRGEGELTHFRYTFNPENKLFSPTVIARFHIDQTNKKQFFIGLAVALLVMPRDTVSP